MTESALTRLAAIEVTALDGGQVQLGSMWRESLCVVAWTRHFG